MKPRNLSLLSVFVLALTLAAPLGCNDDYAGPQPPRDQLNYPIGVTFHPNGRYLYVVNSNFDSRYRLDTGGTVSVIDADTLEMLPQRSPFLPSFGSLLEFNDDASKAYVATRSGNSVVSFDVAADGSALFCTTEDDQRSSDPRPCQIDRVPDQPGGARLPTDPFGLAVFSLERNDQPVDVVNLSHLRGTRVSSISLPGRDLAAASLQTAPIVNGGNAIAQRPGTQHLYVSGRFSNGVAIFQPFINDVGEVEALLQRGSFALNQGSQQVDARGLVFDEDGDRLYVLTRQPRALHVVKLTPQDSQTGSGTRHNLTSSIPLPVGPSDIVLHTTPQGRRLAYVSSFNDHSIQVVDVDAETIIDEILLNSSPYQMAIEPDTMGCSTPEERCRLFVSLFDDTTETIKTCEQEGRCGSLAVIDINPLHQIPEVPELSRYHRVIQKIR
jgi:DNA-binding beta-propeller fold protein YncE